MRVSKIKRLHNSEHCCPFWGLAVNNITGQTLTNRRTNMDGVKDVFFDKDALLTHDNEVIMMLYFISDTRSLFRIISCSSEYFD